MACFWRECVICRRPEKEAEHKTHKTRFVDSTLDSNLDIPAWFVFSKVTPGQKHFPVSSNRSALIGTSAFKNRRACALKDPAQVGEEGSHNGTKDILSRQRPTPEEALSATERNSKPTPKKSTPWKTPLKMGRHPGGWELCQLSAVTKHVSMHPHGKNRIEIL